MDPQAAALGVDGTDPLIAVLAWALTLAASRLLSRAEAKRARHFLPLLSIALAVGLRAALDATRGQPLTGEVVLRGFGSAAVAVLAHSQLREAGKWRETRREASAPTPPDGR